MTGNISRAGDDLSGKVPLFIQVACGMKGTVEGAQAMDRDS